MATSTLEETWTACFTLPNVPSPRVLPISYLPTCFLAAIVLSLVCVYRRGGCWLVGGWLGGWLVGGACGATAAETYALAGWREAEVARAAQGYELRAQLV